MCLREGVLESIYTCTHQLAIYVRVGIVREYKITCVPECKYLITLWLLLYETQRNVWREQFR